MQLIAALFSLLPHRTRLSSYNNKKQFVLILLKSNSQGLLMIIFRNIYTSLWSNAQIKRERCASHLHKLKKH